MGRGLCDLLGVSFVTDCDHILNLNHSHLHLVLIAQSLVVCATFSGGEEGLYYLNLFLGGGAVVNLIEGLNLNALIEDKAEVDLLALTAEEIVYGLVHGAVGYEVGGVAFLCSALVHNLGIGAEIDPTICGVLFHTSVEGVVALVHLGFGANLHHSGVAVSDDGVDGGGEGVDVLHNLNFLIVTYTLP